MKNKYGNLEKALLNLPGPEERIPVQMRQLIESGNFRFDVHTHIFNRDYIPDRYFGIRIPYMVNPDFLEYVEDVLSQVQEAGEVDDKLRSYAYFIDFSTKNTMEDIAEYLIFNSPHNTIFLTIALDLETAIDGKTAKNYEHQLNETAKVRDKHPDVILPFFEVNPNRRDLDRLFALAFEKLGFFGLKVYPAFGYLPTHPKLMKIFELCEHYDIPVITHCGVDAAHTSQSFLTLTYQELDGQKLVTRRTKKVFLFKNQFVKFFNRPQNWEPVLKMFPRLRLDFAHFGGEDDWDGNSKTDRQWTYRIYDFMERYPNVYADVSHILHLPQMPGLLKNCISSNSLIAERTLFGTDFYMITAQGKYKDIRMRFVAEIGSDLMHKISVENPLAFLGLKNLYNQSKKSEQ